MPEPMYRHICEVCGRTELLTPEDGFQQGWDYPPRLGSFGVVSPRTCGSCPMTGTLWWRVTNDPTYEVTTADLELIARIESEPGSIVPLSDRLDALRRTSGSHTGQYEPGYLEDLRAEWPE